MGLLVEAKVKSENRKSVDFALMKSVQNNTDRETFVISEDQFESLGLEDKAIAFTDGTPFVGLVIVTENSVMAQSLLGKRDSAKVKSRQFSANGFAKVLTEKFNLKPIGDRKVGYKAVFTLTVIEEEDALYKELMKEVPEDKQKEVSGMVKIDFVEETEFTARKRKEDNADATDEAVEPTHETEVVADTKKDDDLNFED